MDVKTIQKYKGKSVSALLGLAQKWFNEFIRLRDSTPIDDKYRWGRCISSGRRLTVPNKNSHAGHFYSAGKYPALRFNEDNVHLQGKSDNFFASGNQLDYQRNLINKIGADKVDKLHQKAEITKGRVHKWDRLYLIEIIETYKSKVKNIK